MLLFITFFCLGTFSYAQVGIGTTNPDASAMLEIQSNSKGVLIPRMNTLARTGIASPAAGLLVFDTVTNSFWYYNSGWVELVSEKTLVDTDNDTKIEVEKVTDTDPNGDEINFTTRNVERMKIGNDGEILMGTDLSDQGDGNPPKTYFEIGADGTIKLGNKGGSTTPDSDTDQEENYTKITSDGSLSYVGNATRWEDLKVPVNTIKIKGTVDDAKWDDFIGNTALLWFEGGKSQDAVFTVQMPHGWKEGTAIYPHVHWTTGRAGSSTGPEDNRVEWNLEYTWAKVGEAFSATSTNTGSVVAAPNTGTIAVKEHVITPLGPISGNGKNLSSMLICRLYRSSTDTFGGDAGLLEVDFHYQVDSDGSNQEYSKE
ncbi:hypothetical protein GCM10007963_08760 [Lutibacter litoralis]|nr:hypothetical protein GCM10007963_08760 [Lutibacter litoralis]